MRDIVQRPNGLILISEQVAASTDDRQIRRAIRNAEVRRLRRGAYVEVDAAHGPDRDARYDLVIDAVLATRRSSAPLSHQSAARIHGIPIASSWSDTVHFTVEPESRRRTKNGVLIHRSLLMDSDLLEKDGVLVTSIPRTLIDIARTLPRRDSVAALDMALRTKLVERDALLDALEELPSLQGRNRARWAIDFASPLANRPGESFSRVLLFELGYPAPELQHAFNLPDGSHRDSDFWWNHIQLAGEFDGRGKYFDPQFTKGRSPEEVFWQEKLRENELRDLDARLTRWTWQDLELVQPFIRRLESAGLRRHRAGGAHSSR